MHQVRADSGFYTSMEHKTEISETSMLTSIFPFPKHKSNFTHSTPEMVAMTKGYLVDTTPVGAHLARISNSIQSPVLQTKESFNNDTIQY